MITHELDAELTIAGVVVDLELKATGRYVRASRGYREPGGLQIEPDEPEGIEDLEVFALTGKPTREVCITDWLSTKQLEEIQTKMLEER